MFSGFPSRSNRKWVVQPQKMVRGLKFHIKEAEGLYYVAKTADLCLRFHICNKLAAFKKPPIGYAWQRVV